MAYKLKFYLKDNSTGKKIQLPVNPADIKLKYQTDDNSQTIVNLGEVNTAGNLKLVSVQISSTFPKRKPHYLASKKMSKPDTYISKIKSMQKKKHKVKLTVSTTKISMTMTISSFEYGLVNGYADEYAYTLELKQYRKFGYKKKKNPKRRGKKNKKSRVSPAGKVGMGSKVKVNGRLHRDSYGAGPGMYVKNTTMKVSLMAPGRAYPIHVATLGGLPQGWVKKSDVKKI
ncbi:hypothetical protein [Lactobacillus sp. PSON]|uniref:hypothetical protein n=1 Tax=Lactobacillus sp. PSON TaxID=3455454 RepID=UPI004040F369